MIRICIRWGRAGGRRGWGWW